MFFNGIQQGGGSFERKDLLTAIKKIRHCY